MSRQSAATSPTSLLRRHAKRTIDELDGPPLRLAADFLTYVRERQANAATKELLEIPGLAASLARGLRDTRSGRVRAWRKVRSDV